MEYQMGKKVHDTALTVDELTQRALQAKTLLGEIRALFPEAHGLAKDDRRRSQGKMGADEAEALRGVVDAMDVLPAVFDSWPMTTGGMIRTSSRPRCCATGSIVTRST